MADMKKQNDRCEPWCRHWFRTGGESLCAFGLEHIRTEKGAACMGRKERTSGGEKLDYSRAPGGAPPEKKRWVKRPDDPYCRPECEYFSGNACHFGPQPCATDDGARCIGRKRVAKKRQP